MGKIESGLAEYKGAIAGLMLQTVSRQETGSQNEPMDESGNINQFDFYGNKEILNFTGGALKGSNLSAIKRGATLTISNVAYKITGVTENISVTGSRTYQITAERGLPMDDESSSSSGGE